jgi:hypothetical protein
MIPIKCKNINFTNQSSFAQFLSTFVVYKTAFLFHETKID